MPGAEWRHQWSEPAHWTGVGFDAVHRPLPASAAGAGGASPPLPGTAGGGVGAAHLSAAAAGEGQPPRPVGGGRELPLGGRQVVRAEGGWAVGSRTKLRRSPNF